MKLFLIELNLTQLICRSGLAWNADRPARRSFLIRKPFSPKSPKSWRTNNFSPEQNVPAKSVFYCSLITILNSLCFDKHCLNSLTLCYRRAFWVIPIFKFSHIFLLPDAYILHLNFKNNFCPPMMLLTVNLSKEPSNGCNPT